MRAMRDTPWVVWLLPALCIVAAAVGSAEGQGIADAAKRRDTAAVRVLLQSGVDVNVPQADGATALHWAAHWNDLDMAGLLIRAGARPSADNDLHVTPLSLACANGSAAMVERLLAAGANHTPPPPAISPVMTCSRTGSLAAVRALLSAGADANALEPVRGQTALMWAVAQDHSDIVRLLLQHRADPTARSYAARRVVNRADPNDANMSIVGDVFEGGSTPLLLAARQGSVASAAALLDAGAPVDDIAPAGGTSLVVAAHSNQAAVAALLLERGANPNVIGAGYTALHAAVLRGNLDTVRALIARRANVDARVRHGTPTTRATQDYFLSEGMTGATPLWLAARFLEVDIMRALLSAGADWRLSLPNGTSTLMAAAGLPASPPLFDRRDRLLLLRAPDEEQALEAVRLLLGVGGAADTANAAGETALHGAATRNYAAVARLLVEQGARLDARNADNATPLDLANGPEVARALQSLGANH
jgi:ankyrin repeat protein